MLATLQTKTKAVEQQALQKAMRKQSILIYLYPYISIYICIYKVRVLLAQKKGSTLFAERYTPNSIVLYNFWREHRLIVVDPNKPIHFRLDATNREQL